MKLIRRFLFWTHLGVALAIGTVVLIMSVTGVLLTYQRQMTAWADMRGVDGTAPPGAQPLAIDAILARVAAAHPAKPTSITWRARPDAPIAIAFGRERTLFVNAYTGDVAGEGSTSMRRFFRVVTDWHRWLARSGEDRAMGRSITGAANLGFLFLVVSGLYLWWPRRWSRAAVRNVVLFRGGLAGRARDFNWHNVIGLWAALPLVLVVASGVMISYPWATALVYRAVGETPPAPAGATTPVQSRSSASAWTASTPVRSAATTSASWASHGDHATNGGDSAVHAPIATPPLEPLVATARQKVAGWRTISLTLPDRAAGRVTFALDTGTGGQPQARSQLTLDRATGAEVKWETFGDGSPGRRLRSILRFTHTGEVLGVPGQTIAGLVSLGAVILVWSGFALSWRRFRTWRGRPAA